MSLPRATRCLRRVLLGHATAAAQRRFPPCRFQHTPVTATATTTTAATTATNTPRAAPRRALFWLRVLAASALAAYAYTYHTRRTHTVERASEAIACDEPEILDTLSRVRLTSNDLVNVYSACMAHRPSGLLTLEEFARIVAEHVDRAREQRRQAREARTAGDADSEPSYWDAIETREATDLSDAESLATRTEELSAADAAKLARLRLSLRRPRFEWFELIPLLQTILPVTGAHFYDLRDLMLATSQLAYDHRSWAETRAAMQARDQWDAKREYNVEEQAQLNYEPAKKLELAWRLSDERRSNALTPSEVTRLVQRLWQSGHFTTASIVQASELAPLPRFALLTPEHITRMILARVRADVSLTAVRGCNDRQHSAASDDPFATFGRSVLSALSPFAPRSSLPVTSIDAPHSALLAAPVTEPLSDARMTVSYSQFMSACCSLSTTGEAVLWYLIPRNTKTNERAGPIRKRRMKWQERARVRLEHPITAAEQRMWEQITVG